MSKSLLKKIRLVVLVLWLLSIFVAFYFYFFQSNLLRDTFVSLFGSSLLIGYVFYLLFGSLRGFFLIPVTYLIILGLLFFPPVPLYLLTLTGVMISSASIYYFTDFLDLDTFFEKKYQTQITKLRSTIQKNELPLVIAWSFFPFAPTDLVCYICGTLEINFKKFMLGIFIGEGITCALYIFLGNYLVQTLFP